MEDNSMNSMSKLSISCDAQSTNDHHHHHHHSHDLDDEESGWTMYFEDFYANTMDGVDDDCDCDELNNNNNNPSNLSSASGHETSLVSDAGSSAAAGKKMMSNDDQKLAIRSSLGQSSKKLSFKKRRSFKGPVLVDDALEDTASSPANSPKVSYLNEVMTMNPKEKKNLSISKAKGSTYGQVDDARKAMDFIGRDSDCSELKKRGLCLVPLSMVANYLG